MGDKDTKKNARIAVVGAGWWSQGWHLPHLSRNVERVSIAAVVDIQMNPASNLNPDMESLEHLSERYQCPYFHSCIDMMRHCGDGDDIIDGVIICTPHSTHYEIGSFFIGEASRRRDDGLPPLHILMEKPMTTSVPQAKQLHNLVRDYRQKGGTGCFLVNHSANFRRQAQKAQEFIAAGGIGRLRHITGFMASPLIHIFDDPANKGWNEPDGKCDHMLGNGFAWGQSCHLLGWIFHVVGEGLTPQKLFCAMNHSDVTGADVSHSATIVCEDGVNVAISGTTLLPGNHGPVGKRISIKIFGTEGSVIYVGDDRIADSGQLEHRTFSKEDRSDSTTELPCPDLGFDFENTNPEGTGPESLQNFIDACLGLDYYDGASSLIGLKTVQTVDAMYRSCLSGNVEEIHNE